MATTQDDEDGFIQPCNFRQAIFYMKSARFWGLIVGALAWAFLAVLLESYWPHYADGTPLGGIAVLGAVIYCTSAPSKSPEWKRLES